MRQRLETKSFFLRLTREQAYNTLINWHAAENEIEEDSIEYYQDMRQDVENQFRGQGLSIQFEDTDHSNEDDGKRQAEKILHSILGELNTSALTSDKVNHIRKHVEDLLSMI